MLQQAASSTRAPAQDGYVRIENVSKSFDGVLAVNDVSLSIPKGELFVKSTGSSDVLTYNSLPL